MLQVPGIEVLGPLPGDLHMVTVFVGAIEALSGNVASARALLDFLRAPSAIAVFRGKGLDPA